MRTIKIPSWEGYKRLENLIAYQSDNFNDFELKEADWILDKIKTDSSLTEKERGEMKEQVKNILKVVGDFNSLVSRIQEGTELDVTEDEVSIFQECIKNQLELSEARLEDFREDRFGWGKTACQTLIESETVFHTEMDKFLKTLDV